MPRCLSLRSERAYGICVNADGWNALFLTLNEGRASTAKRVKDKVVWADFEEVNDVLNELPVEAHYDLIPSMDRVIVQQRTVGRGISVDCRGRSRHHSPLS